MRLSIEYCRITRSLLVDTLEAIQHYMNEIKCLMLIREDYK